MSIVSAQKIFIDADEEINFIVEKVLNNSKDRVILVIPQNSLLTTSLVSIKVLAKQVLESNKLMVIVTEDAFSQKLSERAGLITVNKVSDVTPEIWEKVQLTKERDLQLLRKHQQNLLNSRKENMDGEPAADVNIGLTNVADTPSEQTPEKIAEPEKPVKSDDIMITQKKRIPPKMVEVDGVEIYVGGDISDVAKAASPVEPAKLNEELDVPEGRVGSNAEENVKPEFIGKDWTRMAKTKQHKSSGKGGWKLPVNKRVLAVIIFLIIFLGGLFLVMNNAIAVVNIKLKTEDVPINETITARTDVSTPNTDKLTIPALEITSDEVSRSASANTTGVGKMGDKASGVIDFYNKTSAPITVPAGKAIISVSTNLKYIVKQSITVPAKQPDNSPGLIEGSVEAESFGENYNIVGSSSNTQFKVDGYDTNNLVAVRIRDFTGGTSHDVTVVSQQDLDGLKKQLSPQVSDAAIADLSNKVPPNYILLAGSQVYTETKVDSLPKVGEQGTNFNLSVYGKATALVISESNLQVITQALISKNQNSVGEFEVDKLENPQITNVVRSGGTVTFKLASSGKLQSKVSVTSIQQSIAGKTLPDAKAELDNIPEIEEYTIDYSAKILPDFLQFVPNSADRIKVRIK